MKEKRKMALSETDKEAISLALEEFSHKPGEITSILEQYLSKIAESGSTIFPWNKLKPLLLHKLEIVTKEFHEKSPMSSSAARPNVENTTFEELFQRLLDMLQQFNGTPFTIQRLCELVTNPRKHYQKTEKFMRGVEKNLSVVTTVDPYGNRVVHESKQSSMVNGLDGGCRPTDTSITLGGEDVGSSNLNDHSISSPYVPPAPRNSPVSNSSSSASWFSLSNVVDSPSSYPSGSTYPIWRTKDRDRGDSPDAAAARGDQSSDHQYDDDADSAPPPRKQAKLESQDSIDHTDWTTSTSTYNRLSELVNSGRGEHDVVGGEDAVVPAPCGGGGGSVLAPILGQLLGGKDVEPQPNAYSSRVAALDQLIGVVPPFVVVQELNDAAAGAHLNGVDLDTEVAVVVENGLNVGTGTSSLGQSVEQGGSVNTRVALISVSEDNIASSEAPVLEEHLSIVTPPPPVLNQVNPGADAPPAVDINQSGSTAVLTKIDDVVDANTASERDQNDDATSINEVDSSYDDNKIPSSSHFDLKRTEKTNEVSSTSTAPGDGSHSSDPTTPGKMETGSNQLPADLIQETSIPALELEGSSECPTTTPSVSFDGLYRQVGSLAVESGKNAPAVDCGAGSAVSAPSTGGSALSSVVEEHGIQKDVGDQGDPCDSVQRDTSASDSRNIPMEEDEDSLEPICALGSAFALATSDSTEPLTTSEGGAGMQSASVESVEPNVLASSSSDALVSDIHADAESYEPLVSTSDSLRPESIPLGDELDSIADDPVALSGGEAIPSEERLKPPVEVEAVNCESDNVNACERAPDSTEDMTLTGGDDVMAVSKNSE